MSIASPTPSDDPPRPPAHGSKPPPGAYGSDPPPAYGSDRLSTQSWLEKAAVASQDQRDYQSKLEHAAADHVFRYVFLINNASVEQYVSQSRAQAESSFILSRRAALAGFVLLVGSIVIGIIAQLRNHPLDVAYLAGIGGVITQVTSGVFFGLYNRTLQQINLFYQGIMTQQTEALDAIGRASEAATEAKKVFMDELNASSRTSPPPSKLGAWATRVTLRLREVRK